MTRFHLLACLGGFFLMLIPSRASEASEDQDYLNGGYYLLHQLCDDEAGLSMIMMIKNAPPEIGDYTKHVSRTAKASLAALDNFQDGDSRLQFDKNPLPAVENDVRDSIRDDKQHQLVFGTQGPEFVRTLLVSQIEASGYAMHLAKVLAEHEKNPDRIKALQRISAKWLAVRQETYRLLRNQ